MLKTITVAIDGPAGAGKSTISKIVAKKLGFIYIDTGAMYRAAALYAIEHEIDIRRQREKLISVLPQILIDIRYQDGEQHIFLGGRDVSARIREADVSIGSSDIAVIPEVREMLVRMQRKLAAEHSVIMDGRDIGTQVLPDAAVKIFLTASVEDRAKRRYDELCEKGMPCDIERVRADIRYRDKNDSERKVSPLKKADDAVLVDTTGNTLAESVEKIYRIIAKVCESEEIS